MEDYLWYVVTNKDTGTHQVRNEFHVAKYENEYVKIREFDTNSEAQEALAAREANDPIKGPRPGRENIIDGKIRGDIKKGSVADEDIRAKLKAEIMAEIAEEATKAKTTKK